MAAEMNGYGLVASIIQAIAGLAWPAAFVVAVYLFRQRLTELLPRFYVKHKDWEASFRLDQAEKEAAALPLAPQEAPEAAPTPEERDRFEELLKVSPQAAILEIRRDLDNAVLMAATAQNLLPASRRGSSMLEATRALRSKGLIEPEISAILDDLRNVGNSAAHGQGELTESDARRYKKLAERVRSRLNILL